MLLFEIEVDCKSLVSLFWIYYKSDFDKDRCQLFGSHSAGSNV